MSANLSTYPYKATTDARSAMAGALAELLKGLRFKLPGSAEPFGLAETYADWASFESRAVSGGGPLPAAAILPDRSPYLESALAPRFLEHTWSGGDPTDLDEQGESLYPIGDGSGDGFGLVSANEIESPFLVLVRALTKPQRKSIVKGIEEAFLEDDTLPNPSEWNPILEVPDEMIRPVRYGRSVLVRAYYDRRAIFTLKSQQILDNATSAGENRWFVQLEIEGRMQQVALRRVRALQTRLVLVSNDEEEQRGT